MNFSEIKFDEQGLIPAIVQNAKTREVLTLAYMNRESLERTLETNETWFWSRSRKELWHKGATSGNTQTVDKGTTAAADQIGMPIGYDNSSIVPRASADGLASFYDYSQLDRRRMGKNSAPIFFVTAAQTQLLLAEARFRGWITTGTAAQYFSDGIKAHMDQLVTYDAASAVAPAARDAYVAANPLVPGMELQQINTQYWIASFLNGPEAFANFRRSGYPLLTPNPYPSADVPAGNFIRRITYPTSEISANTENLNAAITLQGPDKLTTRVWWDKQ